MADFNDILKLIDKSISDFSKQMPAVQQGVLDDIILQLRKLDLTPGGDIKTTVANIKVLNSVKAKLTKLVLSEDYTDAVKKYVDSFDKVTTLQNDYWTAVQQDFTPTPLLREIRIQAIDDTVSSLTEAGIGANISSQITDILRTNISTGGSYRQLEKQLRDSLTDTDRSEGIITKYTKQITTDAINQYSAQYTNTVASGLGFEWFAYRGTEIKTTRPFCRAMVENKDYFHISEVPDMLKANGLYYKDPKTGAEVKVQIYDKTGLPSGMIEGTNPDNFFIYRGGYNCGHQCWPVTERNVPQTVKDTVFNTIQYQKWKAND